MDLQLHNIDCFEYLKSIPDNSISCIVTDPPYGISFSGQTSDTSWDDMEDEEFYEFISKFLKEVYRVLKNDGTCWLFCGRTMVPTVFRAIEESGLHNNLQNWLTYARQKGRGAKNKLKSQAEEVLHLTKSNKYVWNAFEYLRECVVPYVLDGKPRGWFVDQNTGMRMRWSGVGNVLCFTSPFFKSKFEKQIHSTQKPVLLLAELITLSSNPGDTIYDFFAGSGSTGVASEIMGRNFVGTELDTDMYNKAQNWLSNIDYELAKEYVHGRIRTK